MKLITYMQQRSIDDDEMARRVGGITAHGIKKLKYGERNPSGPVAARIEAVTGGEVRIGDMLRTKAAPPVSPVKENVA